MTDEYMQKSTSFELIGMIDEFSSEQQQLTEIIESIDLALEELQQKRLIPQDYLSKLQIGKKTDLTLPYLYFLPEAHQVQLYTFSFFIYFKLHLLERSYDS